MARKYEITVCRSCCLPQNECRCDYRQREFESVTAIELRDVEPLVEALRGAVDMVHDWASYASDHFQEKHDLEGDLNELRAALKAFEDQPRRSRR